MHDPKSPNPDPLVQESKLNATQIEAKWQRKWSESNAYVTPEVQTPNDRPKFYALNMFPYPSGTGLHVGHLASYTPTDVVARYKRMKGYDVLHPMGWDAFGLPAEQFAIKTGVHPQITTQKAIENFKAQLSRAGFSFDWSREISTCEPSFYRWTQHLFLMLYEKGLIYEKEAPVNWCPALKTVLANEEVIDGKSERGGHPVVRMPMRQWMIKITAYAERLLEDLQYLEWPERTKEGQRNWIGRSQGARVRFTSKQGFSIEVYTTRPDTLFGVTYLAIAPEHPLVGALKVDADVKSYIEASKNRSEIERKASKDKSGVPLGYSVMHPFLKSEIPVWVSDYVLMDYGTGAVMGVPGHDERDFEFAQKMSLPIKKVIQSDSLPFSGDGDCLDSDFLNGLFGEDARSRAVLELEKAGFGQGQVQYKLRDWLFSRQRYWGEPIPLVRVGSQVLPAEGLPVCLPDVADYEPSEKGEPPLARVMEFVRATVNGQQGERVTDTMPGSAGSSWYFLRFCDPLNPLEPFSFESQKKWMPVDLYVGGPEHTVGHLLYARFWHKVLFDLGMVSHPEPFKRLAHQGVIMGSDGQRMSKSRGNTVNVDEILTEVGVDVTRLHILFLGPFEKDKIWNTQGIDGVKRFLERLHRACLKCDTEAATSRSQNHEELERGLHRLIKKVTQDIELLSFNTAIAAMMAYLNEIYRVGVFDQKALRTFVKLLAPFAPHTAEEFWEILGENSLICKQEWPEFDEALCGVTQIELPVQVQGKMRGSIQIAAEADQETALSKALELTAVSQALGGKPIRSILYKPGRILNLLT